MNKENIAMSLMIDASMIEEIFNVCNEERTIGIANDIVKLFKNEPAIDLMAACYTIIYTYWKNIVNNVINEVET